MANFRSRAIVVAVAMMMMMTIVACRDPKTHPGTEKPTRSDPNKKVKGGISRVEAGHPLDPADLPKEDIDKDKYVPAEFKSGADRWRDTGVYVDGKPTGMLSWAELPLALQPTWIDVKVSAPKRADHPEELGWRMGKERRYKFIDYFTAIGIDVKRIKEVHVYGPKFAQSIIVSGKELRSKDGQGFLFRFGGKVKGKALPVLPASYGDKKSPDKIAAVMVYIEKTPPILERNLGFVLGGELQNGVPYYGEPLRGGVRVYLDDKLAAYIKRQELPGSTATITPDGQLHWKLFDVLAGQGMNTDAIVEAWLIRDDVRKERIGRDELLTMTFEAGSQAKGSILLGPNKLQARAIAFHSRPVDPATFPQRDPVND